MIELLELAHVVRGVIEFRDVFREDPRIPLALGVMIIAGSCVTVLIRKTRREQVVNLNLRK
jgi:hypothetical protein